MSTTHTAECRDAFATYERALAEWTTRWPDACETCHGAGGASYSYDPSPAGVALSPGCMYDFDPCGHCIEHGKCPRCDAVFISDEEDDPGAPCRHCGWNHNKNPGDSAPVPPECWCYLANQEPVPEDHA